MTSFGDTMMTEQSRPEQLVCDVVAAQAAGFQFSACADHFQPWLAERGPSQRAGADRDRVSGRQSCDLAGKHADPMIAVEPEAEPGEMFDAALPNPESFAVATAFVTPAHVSEQLGCGPDVEEHVEKIRPFVDAGFTEVALVQLGGVHQGPFMRWAQDKRLPALRSLSGVSRPGARGTRPPAPAGSARAPRVRGPVARSAAIRHPAGRGHRRRPGS